MARQNHNRDVSATLNAAEAWIDKCLVKDGSVFSEDPLWTAQLVDEVHRVFVEHPDFSKADFMTKLRGQMQSASAPARRLMAEMLWALLLFPSNINASTKRAQIEEVWSLSGEQLPASLSQLSDEVLIGIGSGGPGFNNYRPVEMAYLIELTQNLKTISAESRSQILKNYDDFFSWINKVPRQGSRQFRHMLRFFAFPERVERISSNNDRRRILHGFDKMPQRDLKGLNDRQLDELLLELRTKLKATHPTEILDFYAPELKHRWAPERKIKTITGEITVTVPGEEEEDDEEKDETVEPKPIEARHSFRVQAKLAEIGIAMGFSVWLPRGDRVRVRQLISAPEEASFLDDLPLSYDPTTLATIEQIDVLWLKRRSIVRAFEVEHSTAVYSGLLRMADLLALQPNMDIRLHIVAPEERREKFFREMLRPVFSLLERGPLAHSCTFISYESVDAIRGLEHLQYTKDGIIDKYEEPAAADVDEESGGSDL